MTDFAVTGASGHIGAALVRALLARGAAVRVLVRRDEAALEGLDVERVRGDITDPASLEPFCREAQVVFHSAGLISIEGAMNGRVQAVNVQGTQNVAHAARRAGVRRLVHFSSVQAFQTEPHAQPLDERRPIHPPSAPVPEYDRTKAEAERVLLATEGLETIILSPTGVIGPYDFKPSRMGRVLRQLKQRTLPALVQGGFDWVDVRDVADSAVQAATRGAPPGRYLLSGRWASMPELAARAAALTGVPPPRLVAPRSLARVGRPFVSAWARLTNSDPLYTQEALRILGLYPSICSDKARRALGHRARPLEETLADTYRFFDEEAHA